MQTRKEAEEKLEGLVKGMDLPIGKSRNVKWLLKNMRKENHDHPNYQESYELCLKMRYKGWT